MLLYYTTIWAVVLFAFSVVAKPVQLVSRQGDPFISGLQLSQHSMCTADILRVPPFIGTRSRFQ